MYKLNYPAFVYGKLKMDVIIFKSRKNGNGCNNIMHIFKNKNSNLVLNFETNVTMVIMDLSISEYNYVSQF
jgi:hypothetical protein